MTEHDVVDDSTLVERARRGDANAFDALHHRHADQAWRLAFAVTGDGVLAETAVPEAFGSAFTAIVAGRRQAGESFRSALLVATRNASLDAHRDNTSTLAAPTAPLEQAFRQLPERWRSILWLTGVEGLSTDDAALVVGLAPEATVQLAERARNGLSEQFLHAHLAATGDRNCARAVNRLASYAGGRMPEADAEGLERHLELCAPCNERFRQINTLDDGLAGLAPPTAATLLDASRAAWSAAIATPRRRSATGLSPRTEKVLAGASAVVAAAGVLGAALFDRNDTTRFEEAAVDPVVTDDSSDELVIDAGPDLPPFDRGARALPFSRIGSSAEANVVGISASDPAVAGDLDDTDAGSPAQAPAPAPTADPGAVPAVGPERSEPTDEPVLSVGTTIADVPVAVEIGPEPGVTVGPVSVGSAPQPEASGSEVAETPLAPIVEPVTEAVSGIGL